MNPKTDITESEWLSLLDGDQRRSLTPPEGGKLIEEIAEIWQIGTGQAGRIIRQKIHDGRMESVKVGRRSYYVMTKKGKKPNVSP